MIGRVLGGKYRIEEKIGSGGFSIVYRAWDIVRDTTVVIKVLKDEYQSDAGSIYDFNQEVNATSRLAHENIVSVLDIGVDNDTRFMALEYVAGGDLKQLIQESPDHRIPPEQAVAMTIRILSALEHIHRNGIQHRDIKPQNILIDRDAKGYPKVKLTDFGTAYIRKLAGKRKYAGNKVTLEYSAPEVLMGEAADERSDLYSVGIVLYEMLTGKVPFDADKPQKIAWMHKIREAVPVCRLVPQVPRALEEIVRRAMAKDPDLRYQTAVEMANDLQMVSARPEGGFVVYPQKKEKNAVPGENAGDEGGKSSGTKAVDPVRKQKNERNSGILALVTALLLIASLVFFLVSSGRSIRMPQLIGRTKAQAMEEMVNSGIEMMVVNVYSDEYNAGTVIEQSRNAGEKIREDELVTITVSQGSQWYMLPDLTGYPETQTLQTLRQTGVANVQVEYVVSDQPVGTVAGTSLQPGQTDKEMPIVLYISAESVPVPDLRGMTLDGARAVLESVDLCLGNVTEEDGPDTEERCVVRQSVPADGRQVRGGKIDVGICMKKQESFYTAAPLTILVPLDDLLVSIVLDMPSGNSVEVYSERMKSGTHRINLNSAERGTHTVRILISGIPFEKLELDFE